MSNFYARYIPPISDQQPQATSPELTPKRKRDPQTGKNPRDSSSKRQKTESTRNAHTSDTAQAQPSGGHSKSGNDVLQKYSLTQFAHANGTEATRRSHKKIKNKEKGKPSRMSQQSLSNGHQENVSEHAQGDGRNHNHETQEHPEQLAPKHSGVMSRFEKSKAWSAKHGKLSDAYTDGEEVDKDLVLHDLGPIPQPELLELPPGKPSFSALPLWQSNALEVNGSDTRSFAAMDLSKELVVNLEKHRIDKAFPVQSALIPLLLGDQENTINDVCVSATTGSGKTLAYVIPVIEDLRKSRSRNLQAVIVVPTRELVKQVKETCEMCAVGCDLRIVTAFGSKSFREEQNTLIETEEIYNPTEYEELQAAPVDWSTFDLTTEVENARPSQSRLPPNFVVQRNIKADILITTPGRLVDHLKRTRGFHLDDVRWLVIDEADRLLNESYQEWIEVVVPALQSRRATKQRDEILRSMHMDLPFRHVRKILLSATMTRDISKLNALGLYDPKLVVLIPNLSTSNPQMSTNTKSQENEADILDESGSYHIPGSLSESVIPLKDGTQKPLVLLQLLKKILKANGPRDASPHDGEGSDTESSTDFESSSESDDAGSESSGNSSVSSSDSGGSTSSSDDNGSTSTSTSSKARQDTRSRGRNVQQKTGPLRASSTPRVLIFTKSTASASRLVRLLGLLSPESVSDMAALTRSTGSSASSRKALSAFRSSKIHILISTDRASRGVDVPGLEHVINYDIPASALTYVHRVGRTARAGLTGNSWTLLEHREGRWFWTEIGGKGKACKIKRSTTVHRTEVGVDEAGLQEQYESALQKLGQEVRGE